MTIPFRDRKNRKLTLRDVILGVGDDYATYSGGALPDKKILPSKPLLIIIDGQYRHAETQRLSLRKEAMVQASGKEPSRRKRRGAALLQSPAHRQTESRQRCP
jgi:hypothetical protein